VLETSVQRLSSPDEMVYYGTALLWNLKSPTGNWTCWHSDVTAIATDSLALFSAESQLQKVHSS
jgi:hypothetical protein